MALVRTFASTAAVLLLMLAAQPAFAYPAINLDLSYVDKHSAQYQHFKDFVDRAVAGDPGYGFSATDAAYMYKLTGQEPYGKLAVDMVDHQVSDAEAAAASGHLPDVADDSYLNVGPMLMSLSLTYDWCGALLTTTQKSRWKAYADQAVSNVWNPYGASWGGRPTPRKPWAVDDPGDNYFYSFVQATMYWALASDDTKLKAYLRDDRLPMLEKYFAALPGGGSREGTSYGASVRALFALYRLWRDATGTDLANANSHLTDTIYYWINATVPTLDRFAPIGDQPRVSVPVLYDYERQLMLEARKLTNSTAAVEAASWWLHQISISQMTNGFNTRHDLLPAGDKGTPPTQLVYHATGVGQLFARTSWDKAAMWLDFSAGPYEQSHAHQDQGAFTLFAGDWLAVTENIWSHSGIQQGTETNNVVRFERNGKIARQSRTEYLDDADHGSRRQGRGSRQRRSDPGLRRQSGGAVLAAQHRFPRSHADGARHLQVGRGCAGHLPGQCAGQADDQRQHGHGRPPEDDRRVAGQRDPERGLTGPPWIRTTHPVGASMYVVPVISSS